MVSQRAHVHVDQPHELRRAHAAAKTLEERLEVAGMEFEARITREIRERCWTRLLEAETSCSSVGTSAAAATSPDRGWPAMPALDPA